MTNQRNEKSDNSKRFALVIIAIILIAAIAIGAYTYSRYISTQNGSGTAQVGYWGYTVTIANGAEGEDSVFSQSYGTDGTASSENTVIANVANTGSDIVAPGANGSVKITAAGISEVNAALSMALDAKSDIKLALTNGETLYYHPIKFTLSDNDGAITVDGVKLENVTLAQLKTALDSTATTPVAVLAAGDSIEKSYTLSWAWDFNATGDEVLYTAEGAASETSIKQADVDKLDTVLGQLSYNADNAGSPVNLAYSEVQDTTEAGALTWTIGDATVDIDFTLTVTIGQVMTTVGA